MMGENLKFTGERFVPTEAGEIRLEHFHRYAVALGLAADKDVLDLASGEGYGAWLLANCSVNGSRSKEWFATLPRNQIARSSLCRRAACVFIR